MSPEIELLQPEVSGDPVLPDELESMEDVRGISDKNPDGSTDIVKRNSIQLARGQGEWVPPKKGAHNKEVGDDLYRSFVQQATAIDRLADEEERTLGKRVMESGDKRATKKLVLHNMRLAIKMAHQYRREWANLMDLVQEAMAGLAIAAQKWDPERGTRFGTYAAFWIRAQLTKFLMTNARLIHTANTRAGRKVYFGLPEVRRKLLAAGKNATVEEIAAEMGEDPKEVALIVTRLSGKEASLSAPMDEGGGMTLADAMVSDLDTPEEEATESEMQQLLASIIQSFEGILTNDRDVAVWKEHLMSNDPISLVELGARFGVSKQRMGQIANRLKKRFRQHVIDELGPTTQLNWLFSQD